MYLDCKRFRAGVETEAASDASLATVYSITVAPAVEFFAHAQQPFRAGGHASTAAFALEYVNFRMLGLRLHQSLSINIGCAG
jgi:hypothetical protein